VLVDSRVRAQDMVKGHQVMKAELLRALPVGAYL
jgi:hypothetical protein